MIGVTYRCGGVEAHAFTKLGKVCLFVVKNICFFCVLLLLLCSSFSSSSSSCLLVVIVVVFLLFWC